MGFADDPLGLTPRDLCSWAHRFDDPRRVYRTLYCAERRLTCFREVLADFRPDSRALDEMRRLFGGVPDTVGTVPPDWLEQQALASGRLEIFSGELVDIDDPPLRTELERKHADLLAAHGMDHLDISEVRSRNRQLTQALSRDLFDRGAAGLVFRSNLDDLPCVALFEGRAAVRLEGEAQPLTDIPVELLQVCEEFGLSPPEE